MAKTSRAWLLKELSCAEEELLREALKQAKAILSTRLPIDFLPTVLESEKVISSQEYQYIKGEHNSVDKSTMLLDMMEKKSIPDIQNFLKILKTDAFCGYGYLAEMVERDFDALVEKNKAGGQSTRPARRRKRQSVSKEVDGVQYGNSHLHSPCAGSFHCLTALAIVYAVAAVAYGFAVYGYLPWAHTIIGTRRNNSKGVLWTTVDESLPKSGLARNPPREEEWPLPSSHTVPLEAMPCALQVFSSVVHGNKVYVTGIGIAKDKGAKDDVPRGDVSRQIQVYPLDGEGNWATLPEDPKQKPAPNYNAPVTVINDRIALVGGRDAETGKITNVLSTWNEEKHEWEHDNPPPMPTKRLASGVCHRDNLLLVVGGVVDDDVKMLVNTVDVYDFSSNRWYTPEALDLPIAQLRSPHVVIFKDYVYVIGGATAYPAPPERGEAQYNRYAWRALWSDVKEAVSKAGAVVKQGAHKRAAEEEPSRRVEGVWRRIADPPILRPTIVYYEDFLMAVGGVKGGTPQEGIYKFMDGNNVDSCGSWKLVGNMSVGRYRHAVVAVGSRGSALFVAGGSELGNSYEIERHKESSSAELVIL